MSIFEIDSLEESNKRALVTGGAGFIVSHIVYRLMKQDCCTVVLDDLSRGNLDNLKSWRKNPNFKFVQGTLLKKSDIEKAISNCEVVFHIAANPEVRRSVEEPDVHYSQNILATYNLLEVMRQRNIKKMIFTSTSAVYGDAKILPVPENYGPLKPISVYGASKLACEALIASYCHTFDMKAVIYRFANIIGSRSQYGVIFDFIQKLRQNPKKLEILGDGTQTKSYLLVEDCLDAFFFGLEHTAEDVEIFNVGSDDFINVKAIADIVATEAKLKNVQYFFTGGVDGGRGWKGDIKVIYLLIEKLKSLGWRPKHNSQQSVTTAARALLKES